MRGKLYSNVDLDPNKGYALFIGDMKCIDMTTLLTEPLSRRYKKPVEIINVLSNFPPTYMNDNIVVVNPELGDYMNNNEGKYFLPKDQADIDKDVSDSPFMEMIIHEILKNQSDLIINVFKNTTKMRFVDNDSIHVLGPEPELFEYFDSKIKQREIVEKMEISVPNGYIVKSFDDLINVYKTKFDSEAFVNCENGFGGNGSVIVKSENDLNESTKLKGKNNFIITDLLDLESTQSSIGLVANEDDVMFVSVSDQLMDGVEYRGNIYPTSLDSDNYEKIVDNTKKIGTFLGSKGYRGFFGVDYMTAEGETYFAEINPRKVGHLPEIIFAYSLGNPGAPSLPELELNAVTRGTFDFDVNGLNMPDIGWGVFVKKAKKGEKTLNNVPRQILENDLFQSDGVTVLDHPGKDVEYLGYGRLARSVAVSRDKSRDQILKTLKEEISKIGVC